MKINWYRIAEKEVDVDIIYGLLDAADWADANDPGDYTWRLDPSWSVSNSGMPYSGATKDWVDDETRRHEKDGGKVMTDDEWTGYIKKSPVVVLDDGEVLDGNHRLVHADRLGIATVPAYIGTKK